MVVELQLNIDKKLSEDMKDLIAAADKLGIRLLMVPRTE